MPRKATEAIVAQESFTDMSFPVGGLDLSQAFSRQLPRPLPNGEYVRTTRVGLNVRGYEASSSRRRGGSRPGLKKYIADPIVADWIVQNLDVVVGVGYPPPGGQTMQLSASGRVVTLVSVSQGRVFTALPGETTWAEADNFSGQTPPLNFTGVLYSTSLNQKLWFADGVNWVFYDPAVNAVFPWESTAGALPVDDAGNAPRLICTWRGRIVLSGLLNDPQNWFMSAVGDPTDFDYAPLEISPTQAVAGNNSPLGLVGDVITTLIPYTDDVLIFGGDGSIYLMNGDPMSGGQIDLVSKSIGMAWGIPWAMDPFGTIFFVSNRTGIYSLVPGQVPVRISQGVEQLLQNIDTGFTTIRLAWNDRFQGLHVFLSPTDQPASTQHLFWEARTGAWWQDEFANINHDPLTCCVFDGNDPNDRSLLIGSWDGFVRSLSAEAEDDDGTPIASSVVIGPLVSKDLDELLLKDLQGVLGEESGDVTAEVFVGATAEIALSRPRVAQFTWRAGRNLLSFVRQANHAHYVKISATHPWSMEMIRARVAGQGKVRRRGY